MTNAPAIKGTRRDPHGFWIGYCEPCNWEAMFNAKQRRDAENDYFVHLATDRRHKHD